jgi:hypothetical protein
MARLISRPFDPTQPVYARRFFVAAGRHYNPGDRFDWQRLSVAQRRVFLLFEAGKLMHEETAATTKAQKPKAAPIKDGPDVDVTLDQSPEPAPDGEMFEGQTDSVMEPVAEPGPADELDDMNMKQLRAIAEDEGAPYRTSRDAQRQAIREHRDGSADA